MALAKCATFVARHKSSDDFFPIKKVGNLRVNELT